MENFVDIKGYEGLYQVSDRGRVKSLRYGKERVLSAGLDGTGYLTVSLTLNGKAKTHKIHQLVAITFLNHTPSGYKIVCDHINNKKTDNRLCNLQLLTQRENLTKDKKGYSSKYVGVSWVKATSKWLSRISINGSIVHLGFFVVEEDARDAYQTALAGIK
jgi:hypothetical protein